MKRFIALNWLVAASSFTGIALARDLPAVSPLPAYQNECASCHVAYPPGALPAQSWARIMSTLKTHYGTDASLDAAQVREIATWLAHNAAPSRFEPPAEDRITRSAWFVREHRKVAADAWQRPSIKSASNCAACHTDAARGDFDEHGVRIPR